jgi:spore maturation protein CgeB
MRFHLYTHSLVSDWNHGNAHFLRGIMRDLQRRGHQAVAYEPEGAWSRVNLVETQGEGALEAFARDFPDLTSIAYGPEFDHEAELDKADVVIVHEWTDPELVARIGRARNAGGDFALLFHDTHHRAVSAERDIAGLDLQHYDLILAFGETLRQLYLSAGWSHQVVTWHEAADDSMFKPHPEIEKTEDLVWIGNWGDDERTAEIASYLIEPAKRLRLKGSVHGVRYPQSALDALAETGLLYRGWVANAHVPEAFARAKVTVHIPRRPYVEALPGIPTIRVFEALACGIPLISAPWQDAEHLFRPGQDFLFARTGSDMQQMLSTLLNDAGLRQSLAKSGLETVSARHTCRHRVDELFFALARSGPVRVREMSRGAVH